MAVAFVRGVPSSFAACVTAVPVDPGLDVAVARVQHARYVAALESSGYDIVQIPVDENHPDSPFVEDTAVVVGERVLITRPGHQSRRGEVDSVADVIARYLPVHRVRSPATIDGGDVLSVGSMILVGISDRTNPQGARALAALAEPQGIEVRPVPVRHVLHLKSGLSALDDGTVLWHSAACAPEALAGLEVVEVADEDPEAANVVRLADGRILVAEQHNLTQAVVADRGMGVVPLNVSEFARADGGLTCLSVRVR